MLTQLHRTRDLPDPVQKIPDLPETLQRFIMKAGRCDPKLRYQDMTQALVDIRPLANLPTRERRNLPAEKPRETSLSISYEDDQQLEIKQLMEEFSAKARKLGVELKIDDN